jgi:hypothetical protein
MSDGSSLPPEQMTAHSGFVNGIPVAMTGVTAMSADAIRILVESVWAVSARRAFDEGYRVAARAGVHAALKETRAAVRDRVEDVYRAAPVLISDEAIQRIRALHDGESAETSHGKAKRNAFRQVLDVLRSVDAVDPVRRVTTDRPRAHESSSVGDPPVRGQEKA